MRSHYDLALDSSTQTSDGTYYKDICSIPTHKFRNTQSQREYMISKIETQRLDLLAYHLYEVPEFDDILLWLNAIADPTDLSTGDTLYVPSRNDIESFYYENRV